jgi:hypothetical protein
LQSRSAAPIIVRFIDEGDEAAWWTSVDFDPVAVAQGLWQQTRLYGAAAGDIIASRDEQVSKPFTTNISLSP